MSFSGVRDRPGEKVERTKAPTKENLTLKRYANSSDYCDNPFVVNDNDHINLDTNHGDK